ncbi:GNAT family N-acetyltransferase [Thermodesulfobacteriota bacterium]
MSDWTIRPYRVSDMDGITALVNLVQPHAPYTHDRWRWEYPDCAGAGLAWVAESVGRIISHIGMLGFDWFVDGVQKEAFLHVDAMTHPDFRWRGIHADLTKVLLEYCHESGAPFSYVFPNEKSTKQLVNLDWRQVTRIPRLAIRDLPSALPPAIKGMEVRKTDRFGDELDGLCEGLRETFRFVLARNHAYLNWRYLDKPDDDYVPYLALRKGTVEGYMIYKLYEKPGGPKNAHIVDLWTRPDDHDAMAALIGKTVALAAEGGAAELSCWMLPHAPAHPVLLEFGFQPDHEDRYLFTHASRGWAKWDEVTDRENWYITMGDSDVY